ncbi:flavodoxin domain-containing protein [Kitasatospora sp. NPDC085879]|jgi:menaquinone-dependent protoporphyrinogen oxidase|uniref:flavodoxin domain-containing protein n=1 Tax=Kitasatospora sp. NPDC085879 TaxID=3154769 RepID=UPI000BB15504|nr:flavodoxin domain-containing protein [Streptomyces sp. TLI_235]PBC76092.1 menaquinone-dependent protoporphyrinogen oxidase [Streptomyces sp. TLI_235]
MTPTKTRKVLVAYGSKHGATAGIAAEIGITLRQDGFDAAVLPAGEVRDVSPYDAVILGGSLYAGHWHRDAVRCAHRNADALNERPVWLFSSGPIDSTAEREDLLPVPGAAREMERLHARGHVTFGGRMAPDTPGLLARLMVRRGTSGDYRNAEQIRAWTHQVAGELRHRS